MCVNIRNFVYISQGYRMLSSLVDSSCTSYLTILITF